jgi:hypothetical protein
MEVVFFSCVLRYDIPLKGSAYYHSIPMHQRTNACIFSGTWLKTLVVAHLQQLIEPEGQSLRNNIKDV